jgi:hypothetical protein
MTKKVAIQDPAEKWLTGVDDTTNVRLLALAGTALMAWWAWEQFSSEETYMRIGAAIIGGIVGNVVGQYAGKATEGLFSNFLPPVDPVV